MANEFIRHSNLWLLTQGLGSQAKLSKCTGISVTAVCRLVKARAPITAETARRIEAGLNLPPDWFEKIQTFKTIPDLARTALGITPDMKLRTEAQRPPVGVYYHAEVSRTGIATALTTLHRK